MTQSLTFYLNLNFSNQQMQSSSYRLPRETVSSTVKILFHYQELLITNISNPWYLFMYTGIKIVYVKRLAVLIPAERQLPFRLFIRRFYRLLILLITHTVLVIEVVDHALYHFTVRSECLKFLVYYIWQSRKVYLVFIINFSCHRKKNTPNKLFSLIFLL